MRPLYLIKCTNTPSFQQFYLVKTSLQVSLKTILFACVFVSISCQRLKENEINVKDGSTKLSS